MAYRKYCKSSRVSLAAALIGVSGGLAGTGASEEINPAPVFNAIIETSSPESVVSADLDNGEAIYYTTCMPCHGETGQGGTGGGAPLTSALTVESIKTVVRNGRNAMPEFGSLFSSEEINDIAHFIVEDLLADY